MVRHLSWRHLVDSWKRLADTWDYLWYGWNSEIVDLCRELANKHDELRELRWENYKLKERPSAEETIQTYEKKKWRDDLERRRHKRGFEQIRRMRER